MSGHSKWATIKRKKGATDAARSKIFTKLTRELTTAARMGGGDPGGNPRLRKAVGEAKAQQMSADSIKRAIQRGTGEIEGARYEEMLYEGTGPGGTLFLVEVITDNRNRTVAELRKVFERHNGSLAGSGTAQWAFDRMGTITLEKKDLPEEKLLQVALEAGAEDYRDEGEVWVVYLPTEALDSVTAGFEAAKLTIAESKAAFVPKTRKLLSGHDVEVCLSLLEALDDHDDVQHVFADFDIADQELHRLTASI
ncbi:MAG TPA: YebC/PmpR family DNA-binding transcriptional regulator, partial [Polyangiaceae bacterium]|jgi:YebC/PmpR family DNA-binding regulatory protein